MGNLPSDDGLHIIKDDNCTNFKKLLSQECTMLFKYYEYQNKCDMMNMLLGFLKYFNQNIKDGALESFLNELFTQLYEKKR
ncbi:PIR Superfamily Protein [Plasmodium ovale wallikeri]|uniref:PIR Superfamily Protein n=1 Tax=Plasmodium ovale wallikeri TaxID=864142 RepID=A0A1A9AGN8_PLAOA|nr:PIR Superfamily Protein [Plasmodium ovale wallikeri]SBT55327.1 PIR Superfamily Protein [Plasmodium ovale wallikeri]